MLVKVDLRSTKNELLDKYSSHVIHRSYVKTDCESLSLCEMLLISACVFSKQFFKEK